MMQPSVRAWLGTSVLGGLLVVGCQHAQHGQATMTTGPQTYSAATVMPTPAPVVMMSQAPAPQPVVVQEAAPAPVEPVVVAQETPPTPPPPPPAPAAAPQAEMLPVSYSSPTVGTRADDVRRRSFADITAKPCYAHADDYSSLSGELELIHPNNIWHLRYASVQDEDRYGGGVTLIDAGPMDQYSSGQCVRVEGRMVDPESRECSPAFRVRSITPLPNP